MTDTNARPSRRAFLATVGGALAAGCSTASPGSTGTATDTPTDHRSATGDTPPAGGDAELSIDTEWTMFGRSSSHTSYSADASGPREDAVQQWSHTCAEDQGDILGTPAIADGVAYVGCGRDVKALEATTGESRWSRTVGRANRFSPALGADHVFATVRGEQPGLYAFSKEDGTTEWSQSYQVVSAPVYTDGTVFVRTRGSGKRLRALNATDGTKQWHHSPDCSASDAVWSPPSVRGETVLYLTACAKRDRTTLFILDRATGAEQWRLEIDAIAGRSAPAVADGVAYFGDNDGRLHAVDLDARTDTWTVPLEGELWTTPTVGPDTVYVGSVTGMLAAVDIASGEVDWNRDVGLTYETTAFDGETLYVGGVNLSGVDPETGDFRWRINTSDTFSSQFASPAVVGNAVVATSCVKTDAKQTRYDNRIHVVA